MGKHIRLALVVLAIAATAGCQLCLIPCYVCLPTGNLALQQDAPREEIGPDGIPVEATPAQLPAR